MERVRVIQDCVEQHDAEALVVTFLPDIRWLTGFTGSSALVIYVNGHLHFITDGRYTTQCRDEVKGAHISIAPGNLMRCAVDEGLLNGVERVVVQAEHLTLLRLEEYKEVLPDASFIPVAEILDKAVATKNEKEKELVLAAQRVTDTVFEYLLGFIKVGMTEHEIAAEIVYQHMRLGASAMSFDPIVASGPNSALPHARPSSRKLAHGDMVVIDMGCFKEGYASDMTRTVAMGEPSQEAKKVYHIVLDAQARALEFASAGLSSRELDNLARSVINDAGYGPYFTHSLGHGVGLQIHEWPSVSWRSDYPLLPGMIITIEPGVYIPDQFGVRIEDMIRLTDTGSENLTSSSKQLMIL